VILLFRMTVMVLFWVNRDAAVKDDRHSAALLNVMMLSRMTVIVLLC
jgi:hypothetical protein